VLLAIAMADLSSSKLAAHTLPGDRWCVVTDEYSVSIAELSAAFFYASCRLLAMHHAIKTDPTSPPRDRAAFYKNICWEMDVSHPNLSSMQSTDRAARPL